MVMIKIFSKFNFHGESFFCVKGVESAQRIGA
jgi:hypothetical protein